MLAEVQFVALAHLAGAGAVEHHHQADELADVAGAVAGVGAQGAAHRAGDADQRFQPGQAVPGRLGDERRQRSAGAGPDAFALDRNVVKAGSLSRSTTPAHALVVDQQLQPLPRTRSGMRVAKHCRRGRHSASAAGPATRPGRPAGDR